MKKSILLFGILVAILLVATQVSYAYFKSSESAENNFNTADYNIKLEEYFPTSHWIEDTPLEKRVTISNNGEADVLLRISYNEMWYREVDNEKRILNNLVNGQEIVKKNWTEEFLNDFVLIDGWYYYNKVLSSGDTVTILESIEKLTNDYSTDEKYELDFQYEVLQSHAESSKKVWGIDSIILDGNVEWVTR